MKNKHRIIYCVLFLVLALIPFVGLLICKEESSTENRTLASFPILYEEGKWNVGYLEELGDYFQDHFGFRNELVTANAKIQGILGGISTAEGVIKGTDGWLYYKDSLDDYQGTHQLSDRALFDISHSLRLMQDYAEERGARFLFTVAPNKNSLYDDNMPYYYKAKADEENNLSRITTFLAEEGVNYADLYGMLKNQDQVLYHKLDSHWNNEGAALAADTLLQTLGQEHRSYADAAYEVKADFEGDLDKMLYPAALTKETEIYYQPEPEFLYKENVESNFDPQIHTESLATGNLVMYRDSFGNALLPFMAEAYGTAFFSRGVPYQMTDLTTYMADTLIVERAERFLPEMAANPPVMEAALALPDGTEQALGSSEVSDLAVEQVGMYTKISGCLDSDLLDTDTLIYVQTEDGMLYEAFPTCDTDGMEGFILYLNTGMTTENVSNMGQYTVLLK